MGEACLSGEELLAGAALEGVTTGEGPDGGLSSQSSAAAPLPCGGGSTKAGAVSMAAVPVGPKPRLVGPLRAGFDASTGVGAMAGGAAAEPGTRGDSGRILPMLADRAGRLRATRSSIKAGSPTAVSSREEYNSSRGAAAGTDGTAGWLLAAVLAGPFARWWVASSNP